MNSRTTASALRATIRVHGPTYTASRVQALAHSTGSRSIRRSIGGAQSSQFPFTLALGPGVQRRHSSQSAAAAEAKRYDSPEQQQPPSSKNNSKPELFPQDANPPPTTRPPPLVTPVREPNTSTFQHLFATGKAYLSFYKTGVKNIYHNTRLLYPSRNNNTDEATKSLIPRPGTRSHLLLRDRWVHDVRRLPIFVLLLIVCGEFTPFVVVAFPSIVPYTCRLPQHVEKLRRKLEDRRKPALRNLHYAQLSSPGPPSVFPAADIARVLGLVSSFWDRIGFVPGVIARPRVEKRLRFLVEDSVLLLKAGGVDALEDEEVILACVDRGIDVVGRSNEELREALSTWLQWVIQHGGGQDESLERLVHFLTRPLDD